MALNSITRILKYVFQLKKKFSVHIIDLLKIDTSISYKIYLYNEIKFMNYYKFISHMLEIFPTCLYGRDIIKRNAMKNYSDIILIHTCHLQLNNKLIKHQ